MVTGNMDDKSLHNFDKFPFCKLGKLNEVDYKNIERVASILSVHVQNKKFYENNNKCLEYTFDFIMSRSRFLVLHKSQEHVLISLLTVFKNAVKRIKSDGFKYLAEYQQRTMNLLQYLIDNSKEVNVYTIVGEIFIEILDTDNSELEINETIESFISKLCYVLHSKELLLLFIRLIRITLTRKCLTSKDQKSLLNWIETNCASILNQITDANTILETLKCIHMYYNMEGKNLKLLKCLNALFTYRQNDSFRSTVNEILSEIVQEFYLTPTYLWKGGVTALLNDIRNLTRNYDEWPSDSSEIFFVFVYLQMQTDKCSWEAEVILKALCSYTWKNPIPPRILMKALLFIYPHVIDTEIAIEQSQIGSILLNALKTFKSLSDLIVFHENQMKWLLNSLDVKLRCRIINYWLEEKTDEDIMVFLKKSKMESMIIQMFALSSSTINMTRLSNIVRMLTVNEEKTSTSTDLVPFVYNKPIGGCENTENVFIVKMSAWFLDLSNVQLIPAMSVYCLNVFRQMGSKPIVLQLFCRYPVVMKTLICCCFNKEQSISIAAFNMIDYLLTLQLQHNLDMRYSITFDFIKLLTNTSDITERGLILLLNVLRGNKQILLNCDKKSVLGLYHLMLNMSLSLRKYENILFEILQNLIIWDPDVIFSASTALCLFDLSLKTFDEQSEIQFLNFLRTWLNSHIYKVCSRPIPLHVINDILNKYSYKHTKICSTISDLSTILKKQLITNSLEGQKTNF